MKYIITIICIIGWYLVSGQNITIKAKNQSIKAVLEQIESKYDYQFAYSTDKVNLNKQISVNFHNIDLAAGLKLLFENTNIAWQINKKNITLFINPDAQLTISGYVKEHGTSELLIGVMVLVNSKVQVFTNSYGYYSVTLPSDSHQIQFSYLGYKQAAQKIYLNENKQIDIFLQSNNELGQVLIKANQLGDKHKVLNIIDVPLKEIANVPMILGEKDPVKYIMQSAGIQKGAEGNSYMYVRGGGPDQNLVLIDDAVVYNAYHFLGLSSLVSGNELRSAELVKGGFSSKYGGRLSSVLNMSLKDGNKQKISGQVSTGILASKILLEGPIIKNKVSFLVSGRRSYIDQLGKLLNNSDFQIDILGYYFYDLHGKISIDLNKRNKLFFSSYLGYDNFAIDGSNTEKIAWGNKTFVARWNHQFSAKLFSNTTLSNSNYQTNIGMGILGNIGDSIVSTLNSAISDYTIKTDLDYYLQANHQIKFGFGLSQHSFAPGITLNNLKTAKNEVIGQSYQTLDMFSYLEWQYQISNRFRTISGLRFSQFYNQKKFFRAEPRVNIIYQASPSLTFNASYSLMNQYLNLVSSLNGLGFPTDIWTASGNELQPQRAHLFSAGVYKNNLIKNKITISAELYYKNIQNTTMLKEGASFLQLFPNNGFSGVNNGVSSINQLLTQGNCTSYGAEFMLKKHGKRWLGNISYTLSRTYMQFENINRGNEFAANYDRTHDLGIYLMYKTQKHFTFSVNWIYGTGYPLSLPVGEFITFQHNPQQGSTPTTPLYDYEGKNNYRFRAYHRLDLGIQYHQIIAQKLESTIELSFYNAYNRANPFFYQIDSKEIHGGGGYRRFLKQISLFPIIPSISWVLKF